MKYELSDYEIKVIRNALGTYRQELQKEEYYSPGVIGLDGLREIDACQEIVDKLQPGTKLIDY